MQLTTRGDIPISLNEKVKLFANQVNLAVSVKLNSTLTRDQPQLRPGSNDILLYRWPGSTPALLPPCPQSAGRWRCPLNRLSYGS